MFGGWGVAVRFFTLSRAVDLESEAVLFGHQAIEARLQLVDLPGMLSAIVLGGGRSGLAGARQCAACLSDFGAYGFLALDEIAATRAVAAQSAASGKRRVSASTNVSASAWSL